MPLPRRFSPALIPLALAALALSSVSVGVFFLMSAKVARARVVADELRGSYEVAQRLIQARAILVLGQADDWPKAGARLAAADDMLAASLPPAALAPVRADITAARAHLGQGDTPINHALSVLADAAAQLRQEAVALDQSAARLSLWGAVGVVAAVLATAAAMFAGLRALQKNLEDKVRAQAGELARAERLASVGFLAAGVAHEINNPLAVIASEAELAKRQADKGQATPEALNIICEEAFRCKAITEKLLETARNGGGERQTLDLLTEAQMAASLAQKLDQARGCRVQVLGSKAVVRAEAGSLRQVLLNLVVNAMEAAPQGEVQVRVSVQAGQAQLEVRDNGAGIAAVDLPRVFEPFFTTKRNPATPGLGLGLSIAHAIAASQGGSLRGQSAGPHLGSVFILELPLETESPA